MSASGSVVVIGGGIVGTACALECARGGLEVTLLERDVVCGSGATAAGMGQIVVMDDNAAELALTRYASLLWDTVAPDLPSDCEYERCGTIWVAADDEERAAVERKAHLYCESGVQSQVLDAAALYAYEPNLRAGLTGGLRVPGDAILYAPRAAAALLAQAQAMGARALYGCRVQALTDEGVLLDDGTCLESSAVVVASGAHAVELLPELPVRPRKGHLVITERYPNIVHHQVVELGYLKSAHGSERDSVAFNVQPRPTGQLLIGSSRQFDVADARIDQVIVRRMLDRALAYLPVLGALDAVRIWTGHRAATPDGLPYIGPLPGHERVLLATGHEGLGITTSLATGRLIADHLLKRKPDIDPTPYLPARMHREATHA
ncbi:FAD-binding oxidoreductase [bacterium]|nr:MAG: FAD-binding oxidoreductase [bacterium]